MPSSKPSTGSINPFFHFIHYQMTVKNKKLYAFVAISMAAAQTVKAQGGTTGINAATSSLTSYVDPVSSLTLAIGAVVGIIGGVRVYIKWNSGDQDINKELMGWGGSCLFLVLVSVVIKAFFGV
ncbi:DUF4134 domain-containing protein [Pedobacter hiemivivus]|nr:DUF4134 domain-containing protein [Pedobacter hiemivivus]